MSNVQTQYSFEKNDVMEVTSLNPVQLHLLRMFTYNRDEASLFELKEVLFNHYCQKVNEEGKRVWNEKRMTNETMRDLLNSHLRTPCK